MEQENKHKHEDKHEETSETLLVSDGAQKSNSKKISDKKIEKTMENKEHKIEEKVEKKEEKKIEKKVKTSETLLVSDSAQKSEKKKISDKEKAILNGLDMPMSVKNAIYICNYIKGKEIDEAIYMLENVLNYKTPLPMKGEVPHRHGMQGKVQIGRYPQDATREFIRLLKSLRANANVNGIDNPIIFRAVSNLASRPFRRFGSGRFKRTHVYLEAREAGGKK